jgi:hypothetical protein
LLSQAQLAITTLSKTFQLNKQLMFEKLLKKKREVEKVKIAKKK